MQSEITRSLILYLGFVALGSFFSLTLFFSSEYFGVTKFDILLPFLHDPKTWAWWLYPIYGFIGFALAAVLLKLSKKFYLGILIVTILFFIWFYFATEGTLFANPIPFGESIYY